MISRITGKLNRLTDDYACVAIGALEYQVLVAQFTRLRLQPELGNEIHLHTLHYLDGNPTQGKLIPRLVGFLTEVEREFFEMFCSVDGVGMRKALRAMNRPVQDVAVQIAEQDGKALATLPGIGPATADRIIAKLHRKMSKFALLVTAKVQTADSDTDEDLVRETFETLQQLGHSESDARRLLDEALAQKKRYKDVNDLLQAVYEKSRQ